MKIPRYHGLGLVLIATACLTLGGCLLQKPNPEEVITRFTETMALVTSFHYSVDATLTGSLPISIVKDVNSATLKLTGDAISQNPNTPQFTLQADIAGTSAQGDLKLSGELINLTDYTYFRLTDLAIPALLPVTLGADSQWYKIRHISPADPNEHKLGVSESVGLSLEQIDNFRQLLSQTPIMEVIEVLPEATVNNQRAYHYKTKLKPEALTILVDQLNQLFGFKLTSNEIETISRYQPEIWINKRTFHLAQLKLADIYPVNDLPIAFDLTLGLSRHNESFKITTPQNTEELDAARLLRGQLPF